MPAGLSRGALLAGLYNTVKGANARWILRPALTGAGAAIGTKLTSGAGAWGAYADIVAAKAITSDFWIGGASVSAGGAAQIFEVQIRNATPASLFEFALDPTAITLNSGPFMAPLPIFMTANAQVQARAGGAAAKDIYVNLLISTAL